MGDRAQVQSILDQGHKLLAQHEYPTRPENHFVIDPAKWDFYAMDCYWMVGDNRRAADHAHEVIRLSQRPDGSERSPMRASEARFALAVVSLRNGDVEAAADWTRLALASTRKSVAPLSMIADEVTAEIRRLYPGDPAARLITDEIRTARQSFRHI
jgi:hypothetical protein